MTFGKVFYLALIAVLVLTCITGTVSGAPTTSVEISRIAADGTTVLANETVTFAWMKENLPITGDGVKHYGHQGPVFDEAPGYYGDPWDPLETINTDDAGALRGTAILDLASLVGGIPENSTVKIIAKDGLSRTFSSSYILSPESSMGPLVLVWEVNGVNVSAASSGGDASDGMRIYFFAEDHVFGNYDMLRAMPESDRYNYSNIYPSTRGLSVQYVDRIRIYTNETVYVPEPGTTLISLNLSDGWNFISVPRVLNAENAEAERLFSGVDTDRRSILAYNAEKKEWETVAPSQIIKPLEAYWIYSADPVSVPLTYSSSADSPSEKILYPGWNAVGLSASASVPAENALAGISWKTLIPWILETGRYDAAIIHGGSGAYSPEREMVLGTGYWIYLDSESIFTELP
ncbi:hypothetical protein SDC9_34992 [bioreactor metagenome]|uniref:Uncharacterized protein n=1 Tax=bioreactor metagenome TaxID=1076179 RepID=A0A644VE48_9ZZZZ|nr:hypothetical protein [Methanocorpusculum sp.]